jgi:hypothetical protein
MSTEGFTRSVVDGPGDALAAIEILPISVRALPMSEVEAAAVEAYQLWMAALGHPAAPLDASADFLRRLCLAHVCHALVVYNRDLAATLAKVGGPAARCRLGNETRGQSIREGAVDRSRRAYACEGR